MRFIDANVFIYAVLKPKSAISPALMEEKAAAKEIFLRVNAGEPVVTTTVHLAKWQTFWGCRRAPVCHGPVIRHSPQADHHGRTGDVR